MVAEVRRSVLSLRTRSARARAWARRIGSIARHLSEASGIPIQVTVDEHTDRLRPEVEAELLRIAQEAMNNAVKHSQAIADRGALPGRPPAARIIVRDDGRGLQAARTDSHGLKIMQRAGPADRRRPVPERRPSRRGVRAQVHDRVRPRRRCVPPTTTPGSDKVDHMSDEPRSGCCWSTTTS